MAITTRETTVNVNGLTAVEFSTEYPYFSIRNDGDSTIFVSVSDTECTPEADGVVSFPSKGSGVIGTGCGGGRGTLYFNGSGTVSVTAQFDAICRFKSDLKGGGGSNITTKQIIKNGVYNASDDNADGYGIVYVNVPDTAFKLNIDKEDLDIVPDIEGDYELVDKDSNCSLRFERVDNPMADPGAFSTGFFAVYTNLDTGVTIPVNIFGTNYRTTADANLFFRVVNVDTSTPTPTFTLELKHSDGRIIQNITWQPNASIVGGRLNGTNWKISPVVNSD